MALLTYQTNQWGSEQGNYHYEFRINGQNIQITIEDGEKIEIVGSDSFETIKTASNACIIQVKNYQKCLEGE